MHKCHKHLKGVSLAQNSKLEILILIHSIENIIKNGNLTMGVNSFSDIHTVCFQMKADLTDPLERGSLNCISELSLQSNSL